MDIKKQIYIDGCSTSPPRIEVINRINEIYSHYWANPSSIHTPGIKSAEILENSRLSIAKILNADYKEIIFTSGATESINLALTGSAENLDPGRIIISSVEHPAVIEAAKLLARKGWEVVEWPVDCKGKIDLNQIETLLSPPTKIVSLIWGQSEIGTIQPIQIIGYKCRERGILFHTDATQYINHLPISWKNLPVDLLTLSAHKFRGPKGIGLLLIRNDSDFTLTPLFPGIKSDNYLRSGTPPVALISGMDIALKMLYRIYFSNENEENRK